MSSFIFNSESSRRYVLALLLLTLVPMSILFAVGVYLEPLDGGLTRIGYYSEREFGWHGAQETFPHTRLAFPASQADTGHYDHYYDIVVLGDSFSYIRPESQWQNYLTAASGESIATLYIGKIRLAQILSSRVFLERPPKVLVVESVERLLPAHLTEEVPSCSGPLPSLPDNRSEDGPAFQRRGENESGYAGATAYVERATSIFDVKLAYVRDFLWHNLLRRLTGVEHTSTVKLELCASPPFSSMNRTAMLVYSDDFKKIEWWRKAGESEMSCRIDAMRRQVEANGYTRFVLMVPPDKLTTLAEYLCDGAWKGVSQLSRLSEIRPESIPRLDQALASAVRKGEMDIYLPNDTHWGSNGQRIAAETLASFLRQRDRIHSRGSDRASD